MLLENPENIWLYPKKLKCKSILQYAFTGKNKNIYISLGSNEGDRFEYLQKATYKISHISHIEKTSPVYESKAWGKINQNNFLNCVIKISTNLTPEEFLQKIEKIEKKLGRIRKEKWGSRTIDIDIIFWGTEKRDTENLKIPHPFWKERDFVLVPLQDIDNFYKNI